MSDLSVITTSRVGLSSNYLPKLMKMIKQFSIGTNVVFLLFSLMLYFGTRALLLGVISPQQKRDDNGKESRSKESSSSKRNGQETCTDTKEQACP